MTAVPANKSLSNILGASGDIKHRQFTCKEKVEQDLSWFQNPEERQRKEREKTDIELFGYSRNASTATSTSFDLSLPELSIVNESIMPVANPEVDERLSESMQKMRKLRGKTLVERHQEKQGKARTNVPSVWNRERDLVAAQKMSHQKVADIMKNASNMADRFSAPQETRQFL